MAFVEARIEADCRVYWTGRRLEPPRAPPAPPPLGPPTTTTPMACSSPCLCPPLRRTVQCSWADTGRHLTTTGLQGQWTCAVVMAKAIEH